MGTYRALVESGGAGVVKAVTPEETVSINSNESNNTPSTPKRQMQSNLTGRDRSSDSSHPQQVGTTPSPGRPLAPQTTGSNNPFLANNPPLRRSSTASNYEPGVDLSSYDVSSTRAMPGYRGVHGTILDGWAEEGEDGGVIPKTWEEEQERRRAAERELHRRREIAEKEEMERRLGEEFWRGEEERFGPVVPEKIRPHSTGSGSANGALVVPGANHGGWGELSRGAVVAGSAPVGGNYLGGAPPPPAPVIQPVQQPFQQPVQQYPQQDLLIHEEHEKQSKQQPQDKTPQQSQVPQVDGNTSSVSETTLEPPPPARNPSPEAYQIKHITWVDPTTSQARRSPILLQNENGPCPLLALVNALTLSTPSSATTALTEILRVREHVSLQLLLDAVFDGVVTRASTYGVDIDMADLFAFLMSLSTGMNVNPRFVFPQLPSGDDGPPQLLGSFEQTREMRLYNSFGVPLYHGWLPSPSVAVYKVMQRAAPTYEEVQNLLLHEEIILHRISTAHQGSPEGQITRQEENVVEDAGVIREWLDDSCTQLTDWGLESLTRWWGGNVHDGAGASLGKVGILFRNDHFCTVMKARLPGREGGVLLSLVTDMGYGGYEEVVWESLVSVNGQGGGFLTGDYRPVGGEDGAGVGGPPPSGPGGRQVRSIVNVDDDEEWETVNGGRRRGGRGGRGQHGHQDQRYQHPPQHIPQRGQRQQQQHKQHTPPSRRSFVDALLGRGGQQQSAQASLWHQPTGPQPPRGTQNPTQLTQHHNNSLPNNPIPPPMLPPRTSSRTDNSTPTPPNPANTNLLDLSSLRVAIAEPTGGPEEHSADYDLALAMQLQEEEDERERQRLERQRRHQSAPRQTPYSGDQPPQPQGRLESEQLQNGDSSQRDAPPPPYEQHVQDQRHPPHHAYLPPSQQGGYIPHSAGTAAPELAYNPVSGHHQPVSGIGVLGGAPRGYDPNASLGRRRSEARRTVQDARGLLNEVAGQRGHWYPGQQGPAWDGHPGGSHAHVHGRRGSGGGSYKEDGGKKDCVMM
ncbi:hypothetical protein EV426DRAFT_641099 [Tirmania nivea]|nr:hypothetical protein EV426DRAFT_641099 [Tirmania nivea]